MRSTEITTLASVHSDVIQEESFLRELEKAKKVYFDWGCHWFYVLIDPDGDIKDDRSWDNMDPERLLGIAGLLGVTSADTVVKIGSLGVEVVIFNAKLSFPTEEEKNAWLVRVKEFFPLVKVSFYKKK